MGTDILCVPAELSESHCWYPCWTEPFYSELLPVPVFWVSKVVCVYIRSWTRRLLPRIMSVWMISWGRCSPPSYYVACIHDYTLQYENSFPPGYTSLLLDQGRDTNTIQSILLLSEYPSMAGSDSTSDLNLARARLGPLFWFQGCLLDSISSFVLFYTGPFESCDRIAMDNLPMCCPQIQ